ncbi:Type III pantothenate kinase [bacterium HR29]|jgi:type III pantothenate kinase|nr:Type III pantothenate kinase [bacterium HR29]
MLLALDIGNTSIHIGLWNGQELAATWRIGVETEKLPDEYGVLFTSLLATRGFERRQVDACIIGCDVPPLLPTIQAVSRDYFGVEPLVVGHGLRTGMRILYDNPRQLGADRIIDAVGAVHLYGKPCIIVDFGTATVFDAVNAKGEYLGGAIAPGIGIASEALFQRAAMLYRVQIERPPAAIGKNTVTAMQSGILFGYVGLVEGLVARFKEELGGNPKVIATGGWSRQIAAETRCIDIVDPELTLKGLRIIYEMNRE